MERYRQTSPYGEDWEPPFEDDPAPSSYTESSSTWSSDSPSYEPSTSSESSYEAGGSGHQLVY